MAKTLTEKRLNARDCAYCLAILNGQTITDAWLEHVHQGKELAYPSQQASRYHNQPHIQTELTRARRQFMDEHYGGAEAFLMRQMRRLDDVFALATAVGPDGINSLPVALGSVLAQAKLMTDSNLNKMKVLHLWRTIQDDLRMPQATKEAITISLLKGDQV